MRRLMLAMITVLLFLAGCGGSTQPPQPVHGHRTPYGISPHAPGFAQQGPPRGSLMLKVAPPQPTLEMYDSIIVSTVPANPRAVAGYTSGFWPTYLPLARAFPHALHVSIAIGASHVADCLDAEPGDASATQVVGWVRWEISLHKPRPCVYSSVSEMATINGYLSSAGLGGKVRRWCAWYRFHPGLVAGCDGVQWTDHALGRNLDQSTMTLSFFNIKPTPPPDPYRIYDKTVRSLSNHQHASEYNTTRTYDNNTCRGVNPQKRVCQTTDYHLSLLVQRLDFVAHHTLRHGHWASSPTNYRIANRGARRAGMVRRLQTK